MAYRKRRYFRSISRTDRRTITVYNSRGLAVMVQRVVDGRGDVRRVEARQFRWDVLRRCGFSCVM